MQEERAKELNALEPFVGVWETKGLIKATPSVPAIMIAGTDSYKWLPGNYCLLHEVRVQMGGEQKESLEIIGFDAVTNTYPMHYFDANGNAGTMRATVTDRTWNFLGEILRFTGGFNDGFTTLKGIWQQYQDGNWQDWMEIELHKKSS